MELALGFPPYAQWPPIKIMYHILSDHPPSLLALAAERLGSTKARKFSKAFRSFVADCLVKDPQARPPLTKLLHSHKFLKLAKRHPTYLVKKVLDHTMVVHEHDVATNKDTEALAAILKGRLRSAAAAAGVRGGEIWGAGWDFPPQKPGPGAETDDPHIRRRTKSRVKIRVRVRKSVDPRHDSADHDLSSVCAPNLDADCSLTTESTTSLDELDDP